MDLSKRKNLIANIASWMKREFADAGSEMHHITFLFKELHKNDHDASKIVMRGEIERFVSLLITRLYRRPNAVPLDELKFCLLMFPDLPVAKKKKVAISKPVNNCLHYGGIMISPKQSRLRIPIKDHIQTMKHIYYPPSSNIARMHLELITKTPDAAANYNMKHFWRKNFEYDDMIIWPRSQSEATSSWKVLEKPNF